MLASRLYTLTLSLKSRLFHRLGEDEQLAARTLWHLVRPHWCPAFLAFLCNLGAAGFEGSSMALFALALQALLGDAQVNLGAALGVVGNLADRALGNLGREIMFLAFVILAVGMVLGRSALQFGAATMSALLQAEVFKDVWNRIFGRIMTMRYAQVSRYKAGDLNQYVWDAHVMYQLLQQLNQILGNLLLVLVYVTLLLWLSWPLTLAALLALMLLSGLVTGAVRRVRAIAEEFLPARVEMGNRSLEFLSGLRLVRLFAREQYAMEQMAAAVDEAMRQTRRGAIWQAVIHPVMQSATAIGVAGLVVAAYVLFRESGQTALPRLLTFLFIVYRLLPLAGSLNQQRASLNDLFPLIRRVSKMLLSDDKERVLDGGRPFSGLSHAIEFRNVSLRYIEGEDRAVKELCFTAPRGRMVALVGESGAGKSTVADLLLRLYDPSEGQILVDGVDLREFNLTEWRNHVGVVSQDTFVFNASIRDNIAFGRLEASEEEIIAAARAANAHDFIMELAEGYDTVVGDRGYRLSGGQRQRIAIARAILRNPEILVLDEATSDLDSQSERLIQKALEELRADRTVLAIAHRLSTIVVADQILVLEDGHLAEQGTHQELLALNGRYARFWQLQSQSRDGKKAAEVPSGESDLEARR